MVSEREQGGGIEREAIEISDFGSKKNLGNKKTKMMYFLTDRFRDDRRDRRRSPDRRRNDRGRRSMDRKRGGREQDRGREKMDQDINKYVYRTCNSMLLS